MHFLSSSTRAELLNLTDKDKLELIAGLEESLPPVELVVPVNLTREHTKGSRWDFDKLIPFFNTVNKNSTKPAVQAALKKARISIKGLPIKESKTLQEVIPKSKYTEVFKRTRGELKYPTKDDPLSQNRRALHHIFLATTIVQEEGNIYINWYAKDTLTILTNDKFTAPYSNIDINKAGQLPGLMHKPSQPSDEVRELLKHGLSPRHLLPNGNYNIDLIRAELFIFHQLWYTPEPKELQDKYYLQSKV